MLGEKQGVPSPASPAPGRASPPGGSTAGRRERLLAWLQSNPELPTPPAIALQVIDKASEPDCALEDLSEIISNDPALCAKVLRTVNSAVYGLRRPVSSIPVAVRFLGIHPLRSLVLAFTLSNIRWSPLPREALQRHWRVSVAGALAARQLASLARSPAPDNDLVAGLVRDLGVFVLHQFFPNEYRSVLEASPQTLSGFQCELEEEALGLNHAEVSAELLRLWRLPPEIIEPVRYHHDLDRAEHLPDDLRDRARLLYLSSQIGQMQLAPHRALLVREIFTVSARYFEMDEKALRAFLDSVQAQMNEFAATLEVDLGDRVNFSEVIGRGVEELTRLAVSVGLSQAPPHRPACAETAPNQHDFNSALTHVDRPPSPLQPSIEELQARLFGKSRPPGKLGVLDGYEVTGLIGAGAMGAVFRALDPRLERSVAIKTLLPSRVRDQHAQARFLQEGRAIATLDHENIVRVYAVGEAAGVPYLVMEYVQGTSLADRLQPGTPLPLREIIRVGMDTASGLSVAHARGFVHRDIKPANLLVEATTGRVKIVDFGLVQVGRQNHSQEGGLVGTPHFMSPEQTDDGPIDSRSDMFSLGSVLYVACTGRLPFPGETLLDVLRGLCQDHPPPVRELNPALPSWLEEVVAGLLTKDPARRFPTAAELKRLLLCHWAKLWTQRRSDRDP